MRRIPPSGPAARQRGMTVVELMIVTVVLAVILLIGVPTFRDASLGSRLAAAANDLLASVQLARSEAIKRNQTVTLCASADGATCAGGGGWEQGWIVRDAAGTVIRQHAGLPAGFRILQGGGTTPISFQPIGLGANPAVFNVCRDTPPGSQERVLSVRASGAAYVTRTTTGVCI